MLAVVYNTVIVAKSHVFCSISHTILHIFKSLLRRYLIIIKMSLAQKHVDVIQHIRVCHVNLFSPKLDN